MYLPSLNPLLATGLGIAAAAAAQVPIPAPEPRLSPRAEWVVTPGVAGAVPANRHWSAAASNNGSLFVFGGRTGTTGTGSKRNDLYEFDATTLTWTEHNADGDPGAPPQRYRNAAAWDPIGNRLVVFGGEDGVGTILGDSWQWDPVTNSWTDITQPGSPPARSFAAMAYDPITTGLLLFGGSDSAGTALDDSWLLFGNVWAQLAPANVPGQRAHHSLVTRSDFQDVLLCGGHDLGASPNRIHHLDVWRWDGTTANWAQIAPTTSAVPAGVVGNQAVYDPIRQRVVLQGGQGISTNSAATGGAYGTLYGGSPSGWCSEFDCVTNEWKLYGAASFNTADPVIGRASRYYAAFFAATGKVQLWGGQNPSGVGVPLTEVKEYQASPIASTVSYGAGCAGSGGTVTLTADNAPWLGHTFTATASNLAANSVAFGVLGFAALSQPLSALHPAGAPGCDLLVSIDSPQFLANFGGSAAMPVMLPNEPSFGGFVLNAQVLQLELPGGALSAITSSNGLTLTLGAL